MNGKEDESVAAANIPGKAIFAQQSLSFTLKTVLS